MNATHAILLGIALFFGASTLGILSPIVLIAVGVVGLIICHIVERWALSR